MKKVDFFLNNPKRRFSVKCVRFENVDNGVILMFGTLPAMRDSFYNKLVYAYNVNAAPVLYKNYQDNISYGVHIIFDNKYDKAWIKDEITGIVIQESGEMYSNSLAV